MASFAVASMPQPFTAVAVRPFSRRAASTVMLPAGARGNISIPPPTSAGSNLLLGQPRRRTPRGISVRCLSALTPEMRSTLDKVVNSHKVLLFMKGTKDFPQCGFSNTVVQILRSLNVPFETLNILENEMLRQGLKEYSSWPTFPQLYIDGEFFGGCDITLEAYQNGQLQELLEKAMCS